MSATAYSNPPWTREESILALDLYRRYGMVDANHPEVRYLSRLLKRQGATGLFMGDFDPVSFRNPTGIEMKLANFAHLDPDHEGGLEAGSQVDRQVWEEFADDLEGLAAAARAIRDSIPAPRAWVFQANPSVFDVESAARNLPSVPWRVKRFRGDVKPGDKVFFWVSGPEAGIVAVGTVLDMPVSRPLMHNERDFVRDPERLPPDASEDRVLASYDSLVEPRLRRSEVADTPGLEELSILRQAQGAVFSVTPEEEAALDRLIQGRLRSPRRSGATGDPARVSSPQPNARAIELCRQLGGLLARTMQLVASDGERSAIRAILDDASVIVGQLIPPDFTVTVGTGVGRKADVPWIGVFSPGVTAQAGVYPVYLFAADGSRCYLSLTQGTEQLQGGIRPLQKRVVDLRQRLGDPPNSSWERELDLASETTRPRRYEAASVYAAEYPAGKMPEPRDLWTDLKWMTEAASRVLDLGIQFDPALEPLHMLLKWSLDYEPATIARHREIAEEKGSVWWGKFGRPGAKALNEKRLDDLRKQLEQGTPTRVYLYRAGEVWHTRLEEITTDPEQVSDDLRPTYYDKDQCVLFVRVSNFESVDDPDWAAQNLLLASDPDPAKMPGALGNQTSPLIVYERLGASQEGVTETTSKTQPELTFEWLLQKTLWEEEALDELIESFGPEGSQVILAGPPGTSKTWLAIHLVRYMTQDRPLAYQMVQFHPSYGYEEFIEGIRPTVEDGGVAFKRVDGVVLEMVGQMQAGDDPHFIVIDEMNRANLPRVLGELMYLFEYRGEDRAIKLQYSPDFSLPKNLHFIGTMNTADRSIRSIDIALRRRFEVFECRPDRGILERYFENRDLEVPNLLDGFEKLNHDLTETLDRHHTIGQAFFMKPVLTKDGLRRIWTRQLGPLLEEYFFDQPDVAATFVPENYWPSLGSSG